jgi:hypothetical protein
MHGAGKRLKEHANLVGHPTRKPMYGRYVQVDILTESPGADDALVSHPAGPVLAKDVNALPAPFAVATRGLDHGNLVAYLQVAGNALGPPLDLPYDFMPPHNRVLDFLLASVGSLLEGANGTGSDPDEHMLRPQ